MSRVNRSSVSRIIYGSTEVIRMMKGSYQAWPATEAPDLSDFIVYDAMYIQRLAYFLVPKLAFSTNSVIKADFLCHRGSSAAKSEMYVFSGSAWNTNTGATGQSTYASYRIIMNPSQNTFQNQFLHESNISYIWNTFASSSPASFTILDNRIKIEYSDSYGNLTYGGTEYSLGKVDASTIREMKFSEDVPFVIGIPEGSLRTSTQYSFEGYIFSIELNDVINDFTGTITPSDFSNYNFTNVLLKPAVKISTNTTCFLDVNSGKYYPLSYGSAQVASVAHFLTGNSIAIGWDNIRHKWNNGYTFSVYYIRTGAYGYNDQRGITWNMGTGGLSPIELAPYRNGWYFDFHKPKNTTSNETIASVQDDDMEWRIEYYDISVSNNTIYRLDVNATPDHTMTLYTLEGTSVGSSSYMPSNEGAANFQSSYDFYDGYYLVKLCAMQYIAIGRIVVRDENGTVIHDYMMTEDANASGNSRYILKDFITGYSVPCSYTGTITDRMTQIFEIGS